MARDPGVTRRVGAQVARRAFSIRAIREVAAELGRVTWPTKEETLRLSIMVIIVATAVGAFLSGIDLIFAQIMDFILHGGGSVEN